MPPFLFCFICTADLQIGNKDKRNIVFYSDFVGVIFLLCKSDIETFGFSVILFASKTREANTTQCKPNITAKQYTSPLANKTARLLKGEVSQGCIFYSAVLEVSGAGGGGAAVKSTLPEEFIMQIQEFPAFAENALPSALVMVRGLL